MNIQYFDNLSLFIASVVNWAEVGPGENCLCLFLTDIHCWNAHVREGLRSTYNVGSGTEDSESCNKMAEQTAMPIAFTPCMLTS